MEAPGSDIYTTLTLTHSTHSTLKPLGAINCLDFFFEATNQNGRCLLLSPIAIILFTVTILQQATVNAIADEGFKLYARP